MSVDLLTFVARVPKKLRTRWQAAFAAEGMTTEIRPDYDPATWSGGDFVVKMQVVPGAFEGAEHYGDKPFVSGCGMERVTGPAVAELRSSWAERCPRGLRIKLDAAVEVYLFQTSAGRSPDGFRLQSFAAATLAKVTSGLMYDPQRGEFFKPADAIVTARADAELFETGQAWRMRSGKGWKLRGFRSWNAALKDAVPEFDEPEA